MPLFHSPVGLYPFQANFVAHGVLRNNNLVVADTGLGKTVIALATAAVLFEDDLIDCALFVVEANKVDEWFEDDLPKFTDLSSVLYLGSPAKRKKIREAGFPQAVVTSYQTARQDLLVERGGEYQPGVLMEALRGKRVLIVFDEMTLLGNHQSKVHHCFWQLIDFLKYAGSVRIMGLTATPVQSSPLNYFALGRLLTPETMGTYRQFCDEHVATWTLHGDPKRFSNLERLAEKMSGVMLRKRKTDPDVIDKFPSLSERFSHVRLSGPHMTAYQSLDAHLSLLPIAQQRFAFNALRAFACHPRSALNSESKHVQVWVSSFGKERIDRLRSSKVDALVSHLAEIREQGASVIVFAYHVGVLAEVATDLRHAGFTVLRYDGSMSRSAREASKEAFRSTPGSILLASSAAERGINLPEAEYVINFDVPITHASYLQRLSRASRIGSRSDGVLVVKTLISRGTVERGALALWKQRNEQTDILTNYDAEDDDQFISTDRRFEKIKQAAKEAA